MGRLSDLWHKINGTQIEAGGSRLMMPKAQVTGMQAVLTDEEFETIALRILQGAPNN